jgi:hypothetical protein
VQLLFWEGLMAGLPLEGGCACGALRYEVTAAPLMVYNCHCTSCQKISGAAFNTSVTVLEASFAFTSGEPSRIEWMSDMQTTRVGWFCGACGSRIANGMAPTKGVLSVRAGTLDDTGWIEPVGDIWTKSAQPWVRFVEGGISAERQPDDYAPFMAKFRAQNRF